MEKSYSFKAQPKETTALNYILLKPDDIKEGEKLPLIIFLHGAGERGTDLKLLKVHGIPKYYNNPDFPVRCICVAPQCPQDSFWTILTHELKELTEYIIATEPVDENRVSCTGISMGGFGTWDLGALAPDLFSCLAPICGGGQRRLAFRLKDIPIWAFHGDIDNIVDPSLSLEMVQAVNKAGGKAKLTVFEDTGHGSWNPAYEKTDLIKWLVSYDKRDNLK